MEKVAKEFQADNELEENLIDKKVRTRMLNGIEKARIALGGDTET